MAKLTEKEKRSAWRYTGEFWAAIVAYGVVLVISRKMLFHYGDSIWEIPLALSPLVPIIFVAWVIVRFVRRMDELKRLIFMESGVITLILFALSAFGYGFLEGQGYPPVDLTMVSVMITPVYFLVVLFVSRKY